MSFVTSDRKWTERPRCWSELLHLCPRVCSKTGYLFLFEGNFQSQQRCAVSVSSPPVTGTLLLQKKCSEQWSNTLPSTSLLSTGLKVLREVTYRPTPRIFIFLISPLYVALVGFALELALKTVTDNLNI